MPFTERKSTATIKFKSVDILFSGDNQASLVIVVPLE